MFSKRKGPTLNSTWKKRGLADRNKRPDQTGNCSSKAGTRRVWVTEKYSRALNRFWRAPTECQPSAQVSGRMGDMGETAGQGGRDILTASASCSRCTCFSVAAVPLPSPQQPGYASWAMCWLADPLQWPLHALGRFSAEPQVHCGEWAWLKVQCSQVPASGRSLHTAVSLCQKGWLQGSAPVSRPKGPNAIGWISCVIVKSYPLLVDGPECSCFPRTVCPLQSKAVAL